ncbi:uncharacterized protein [Dysidea avara]|uniref:uncharacterized protein isoform X2 n=1 Tax=Dysidea avara TaxID=196820 RepID=UPI0033285533
MWTLEDTFSTQSRTQIKQISTTRVFTFQACTVSLKDDWVKVINRISVDYAGMDIPKRMLLVARKYRSLVCVSSLLS